MPLLVYRGMRQEAESGTKYFIVQSLGSGALILGRMMSFGVSFSWEVLYSRGCLVGVYLVFLRLLLKIGRFPFHFWVPSVIAGASWAGCMALATWQKLAPIYLLVSMVDGWVEFSLLI